MGYVIVFVFNKEIEVLKGGIGDCLFVLRFKVWVFFIFFFKVILRKEMFIYIWLNLNLILLISKFRLKIFWF